MSRKSKRAGDAVTSPSPEHRPESKADTSYIATQPPNKAIIVTNDGQRWRYTGKRARVLQMLATTPAGLTQHDTYPWHTRLGGTIHAMREDGLSITTELEGEYRHARYRLATTGSLIIHPQNSEAEA